MNLQQLEARASLQIQKTPAEVYEAIVNPEHMSKYFISQSTGRMTEGSTLMWRFPEFDMEFPVRITSCQPDKYISFNWDMGENVLQVAIQLESMPNGSTVVKITESSMPLNEVGINWLIGNTSGWANFLACLKAYLEYGINLRKGAFDFMAGSM